MKTYIKLVLQKLLGFKNYLFVFSLYIIATLKYNRNERDFLHFLSLLPDHSTILDIGANIGVMTVKISQKLPNSEVFSFEPVPENLQTLKRLLKFFNLNNVKIFDFALGNYNGTAEIILPEIKNVKFQGLSHIGGIEGTEGDKGRKYEVRIQQLDDIAEMQFPEKPVTGIKIDVENYEFEVLKGAVKLIARYKPLIYAELWDNPNRAQCIKLLTDIGYNTYVLKDKELVPFEAKKHQTQNFFFQTSPAS